MSAEKKQPKEIESELIAKLITASYYFIADESKDVVHKTSAELAYDLEDMISINPHSIAIYLQSIGCQVTNIAGVVYWVLYTK